MSGRYSGGWSLDQEGVRGLCRIPLRRIDIDARDFRDPDLDVTAPSAHADDVGRTAVERIKHPLRIVGRVKVPTSLPAAVLRRPLDVPALTLRADARRDRCSIKHPPAMSA